LQLGQRVHQTRDSCGTNPILTTLLGKFNGKTIWSVGCVKNEKADIHCESKKTNDIIR